MTKLDGSYETHLAIRELSLPPGAEWVPRMSGWSLIQIGSGTGYWLQPKINQVLEAGMVVLLAAEAQGNIRASQLGGLSLCFFPVETERLKGLITLDEQNFFEMAASQKEFSLKILPPHSPVAEKMKTLCASRNQGGSPFRLQLLQLFFEVFGNDLRQEMSRPAATLDAKERLREFLKRTPGYESLDMTLSELARMMRCTPRHLSRIFHEVVGVSFRDKHTELRLALACQLLATTESKVVDIALQSGYQSLSLFSLMFTRRFGVSPGRWRETNRNNNRKIILGRFCSNARDARKRQLRPASIAG